MISIQSKNTLLTMNFQDLVNVLKRQLIIVIMSMNYNNF